MTNHTPTPRSQDPEDIQKRNFIKGVTGAVLGCEPSDDPPAAPSKPDPNGGPMSVVPDEIQRHLLT